MPDLCHNLFGEVGVPEVHRLLLQSLRGRSFCRGLQLRRSRESLCLLLRPFLPGLLYLLATELNYLSSPNPNP